VKKKKSGGAAASARTSKVKKIKDGDLDDVKVHHSFGLLRCHLFSKLICALGE
jgi:hypothetical protein